MIHRHLNLKIIVFIEGERSYRRKHSTIFIPFKQILFSYSKAVTMHTTNSDKVFILSEEHLTPI